MTPAIALRTVLLGCVAAVWIAQAAVDESGWTEGSNFRMRPVQPRGAGKTGFTAMNPPETGVTFSNQLTGDLYLTNTVAHNGSGLAIGDVDGNGWPDIYFCNLQGVNQLYRNLGNWRFARAEIGGADCAGQLSTGAAFADVDGDGDLDLLVNGVAAGTRLFANDGKGVLTEVTESGLSRTASATSMALADIDGDGDLDLYCAHYIDFVHLADPTTKFALERRDGKWVVAKVNGQSTARGKWKDRFEALPNGAVRELPEVHGLYRNDGRGRFTAIEHEKGVYLDEQGAPIEPHRDWGLAVMFRDFTGDSAPDLYVCNDNASPDRIWINQGKGTFRAIDALKVRHTSRSSMGVDFADLNRDGRDDFIVLDMLARQHAKRLTQLVKDLPRRADIEDSLARPRFNRNTLFLGREDGSFVEAALLAGVAASDWSWCPIFIDVDLDGYEDLLVSNGFELDVMDQDSHTKIRSTRLSFHQMKRIRQFHPRWATPNASFKNRGDGTFEANGDAWGFDHTGVSYGMALGDLDIDGDLDVVVNNLNEAASLYRNDATAARIAVRLAGTDGNTQAVGARIRLRGGPVEQSQEMICGGRYMSGDEAMRMFAADPARPLSLEVQWRDGTETILSNVQANAIYEVRQNSAKPAARAQAKKPGTRFSDQSDLLPHQHRDEPFDDWGRQPLLPMRLSQSGPGLSWFDLDGDGWEDLMIGAGRGGRMAFFKNSGGKSFELTEGDPVQTDQTGLVGWHDGRGNRRMLAGESNLESAPGKEGAISVFAGAGATRKLSAGPASVGPLAVGDIEGDGDLDLFAGGHFRPGAWPAAVDATVWLNELGELKVSSAWSEALRSAGLASGAVLADLDGDGALDLALATQWGPIRLYRNERNGFKEVTGAAGLAPYTGWWTSIAAGDFDGDGQLDLAAGNLGRNTEYALYAGAKLRVYYGDWDGNGILEVVEGWKDGGEWRPIQDRNWLARGWPEVLNRMTTHQQYAQTSISNLLGTELKKSATWEMAWLDSTVFLNRGGRFEAKALPHEAQLSTAFSVNVGDYNGDGREDLFLAQNFFGRASELAREDGGRGLWLEGKGNGQFNALDSSVSGIAIPGEQRGAALADFNHDGRVDLAVSQNGGATRLFVNRRGERGLRVHLKGPAGNPDGVGARLRLLYPDGSLGPVRTVQSGSGYWSQDAAVQVLGKAGAPRALRVEWPGGREETIELQREIWEVSVSFTQ